MDIQFFPNTKVAKVPNIVTPEEAKLLHDYAVEYKMSGTIPEQDRSRNDDQEFGRDESDSGEADKEDTRDFWAEKNVYFEDMPYEYQVIQYAIRNRAVEAFEQYLREVKDPRTKYDINSISPEAIHVYQPGHDLDPHEDCHDYAFVIYLTSPDEYEGGELHYFEPSSIMYKPELGHLIIAPSELVHEVLPISSGYRCSMTTFFPVELP